jgi:hypothetical protein
MTKNRGALRNRFRRFSKATPALYVLLCALHLGPMVNAQQSRMITFDAPGADTKPGDNNGTYSNAWGAITGSYQDANNAFLRVPAQT